MKYNVVHPAITEQFVTTDLVGFSKMEAKCSESLEPLKAGDKIIVVYLTEVVEDKESNPPIRIPLTDPTIVKQEQFDQFSQRLLDVFVAQAAQKASGSMASGSTPPPAEKPQ